MIKIVRVLNRVNVGGPIYNAAYLTKYISDEYQTFLYAGINEAHEASSEYILKQLGIQYKIVPNMFRAIDIKNEIKAYRYLKNEIEIIKPDIIHTHAAKAGAIGRMAAHYSRNLSPAIVHTYHGNVFDGYFSPIKSRIIIEAEKYFGKCSRAIVAISDKQKYDLCNKYKIAPENKVHVIPLGFDLQKYVQSYDENRQKFRVEFNFSDDQIIITIVGRLTAIKNHSLFLKTAKLILNKLETERNNVKFVIVGGGELEDILIQEAEELKLRTTKNLKESQQADVVFASWRQDIDVINAGSDIVALTSLNEGTPVSLIEAMASKKAVISTNVGGVSDVVTDEVTGLLSSIDEYEYAEKLLHLVENQSFRMKLGTAAFDSVISKYDYRTLVQNMDLLYKKII